MKNAETKNINSFASPAVKLTLAAVAVLLLAFVGPARADDETDNRAPVVPAALVVPAGNEVAFHAFAVGFQIYTWNGTTWGASVPEAVLFDDEGEVVGIHFAGPTWENKDGSKVVGKKLAAATVDPTAIPWLLLIAVSTQGPGILADATYIQRVHTSGGLAPTTPGTVGAVARVPYTAEYFFFQPENLEQTGEH